MSTWQPPEIEEIDMSAEIGSYQEEERSRPDRAPAPVVLDPEEPEPQVG